MTVGFPDFQALPSLASILASGTVTGQPGGIGLLTFGNVIINQTNLALPVGLLDLGKHDVNTIGYEGQLSVYTNAVTQSRVVVLLQWFQGTLPVDSEFFYLYAGAGVGTPNNIYFRGPTKATSVQVEIQAVDNACTISQLTFIGNSRVYAADVWKSYTGIFQAGAGIGQAGGNIPAGVVCGRTASVAGAGGVDTVVLPLFVGKVSIRASTASGGNDAQFFITDPADTSAGGFVEVYNQKSDASGIVTELEVWLPRIQCLLNMRNNNAAAKTLACKIIAGEY